MGNVKNDYRLPSRGQVTSENRGKKPDTSSRATSTAPSMEGRIMESSKDERKANRSDERGVKLPPLQVDTVSAKNRRNGDGRRPMNSKDEWEANRSGERGVKLPPLQADTVSAKNIREEGESRDTKENGKYIETPRRTKKLKP